MNNRCVLVAGGAGYIGSHTAVELINAGYEVVIVDNFSNSDASSLEGIERITGVKPAFVEVDCCDKEAMRRVFERYDFNSAIHFAAFKAVGESVTPFFRAKSRSSRTTSKRRNYLKLNRIVCNYA